MQVEYSQISKHLTLRVRVDQIGTRDCVALWAELCEQLGVTKWATDNPDDSEGFQLEWQRVMQMGENSPT